MASNINKLRNGDFSDGRAGPTRWVWSSTSRGARWRRYASDEPSDTTGMRLELDQAQGVAQWSQTVVCAPETFYRVEATICCDLTPADDVSTDEAGVVLAVQPMVDDRRVGDSRFTPGIHRASHPVTIRAYFEVPAGIRRLKVSIGVADASGTACILDVRCIRVLDPDEASHALAIPAPPHTLTPPRVAQSICICGDNADRRPVTRLLAQHLGEANVSVLAPKLLKPATLQADALFLPDPLPPSSIRSVTGLIRLAKDRIVVISLPALAKLAAPTLNLRRVEQNDDLIHAKTTWANHATAGFALHDAFAHSWPGRSAGSVTQNQFRKTAGFKDFCKKHGFVTLLESMCDQDVTSDRPIALFKETPGGGLYVLDIEPAETPASNWGEPTLAMHLLLSLLGHTQTGIGQFVSPIRDEPEFRKTIREMGERFDAVTVQDAGLPVEEITEQIVLIDPECAPCSEPNAVRLTAHGEPGGSRPWILVRSGLLPGDVESTYGALMWFKQLVRMPPFNCPYADELASQFRLAWVPFSATWEPRGGWRRSESPIDDSTIIDTDGPHMAALIDLTSCSSNRMRVVLPSDKGGYRRYARWLPTLHAAFDSAHHFMWTPPDGECFADRDRFAWRRAGHDLEVIADPDAFRGDAHRDVIQAGGEVVRIEVPGGDADFVANSIHRTDLAATLLEHVIGLQLGLIAVNRREAPARVDSFAPVAPGAALIVDRRDPAMRANASQAG